MDSRMINDITEFIFVSDTPRPSDIIFIPGGSEPSVPEAAAKLYTEAYAPLLLPSGRCGIKKGRFPGVSAKKDIYTGDYLTEYDFYYDVLLKNQVPATAVLCENAAEFTMQNAFFSRQVTDAHTLVIRNAIICCKSFHARRCLMYYQIAFPDTMFLIYPVDVYGITRNNWHTFVPGIDRVLGELARCGGQMNDQLKMYLLK